MLGSSRAEETGRQEALGTGHYGLDSLSLLPSLDPKSCFTRRMSPLSLPAQLSSLISIGPDRWRMAASAAMRAWPGTHWQVPLPISSSALRPPPFQGMGTFGQAVALV